MAENDLEKTESPTPRRLQEAREEGNVARSQDLTAAFALLSSVVLLHYLGMKLMHAMGANLKVMLAPDAAGVRVDGLKGWLAQNLTLAALATLPLALAITAAVLLVSVGQVGLTVSWKVLELDITKLSPLRGFKNLLDARAGVRLAMSLGKVLILGVVAVWVILNDLPAIFHLAELPLLPLLGAAAGLVYELALKLAAILLVLALGDYALARWQRMRDLRMTKQEVKEELKRMEGDPLVKQRRARVARQLALQRIAQAVPKADVIVTNPTHFAVALRYDAATMTAPRVVAKGADFLAMRIRQLAAVHGVPLVERKELARALYRAVEVGQEVPPQFYNAIAEILAYVFRMSGRKIA